MNVSTDTIWKMVATILGWIFLAIWITARISAGNDAIREDVNELRSDVKHLTGRVDNLYQQRKE